MKAPTTYRLSALLVALATALLPAAGCRGDDDAAGAPSPQLEKALSYLPPEVGFAAAVATDPQDGPLAELDRRLSRVEGWSKLESELEQQIAEEDDFERDVRPQLGNPAVFSASTFDEDDPQEYAALAVRDPAAMRRLMERSVRRGQTTRLDDYEGALIVRDDQYDPGSEFRFEALHRAVLIEGNSERQLKAAIDRSKGSDNLAGNDDVTSALAGAGRDALFVVTGDAARLLDRTTDRDAIAARRVPWVKALRDFTVSASVDDDGITVEAEVTTDDEGLSEREVPIATGADPPGMHARDAAVAVALRDPGQFHRFLVGAGRASRSADLREYVTAVDQLRSVGIDVYEAYLSELENLSVALESDDRGSFVASLKSGGGPRFRERIGQSGLVVQGLAGELAGVDPGRLTIDSSGSGGDVVWTVRRGDEPVLRYAVRGDEFVGALGSVALPDPRQGGPVPGTEGALAIELSGPRFADLVREVDSQGQPDLNDATGRAALRVLSGLERFLFSMRAETSGLKARAQAVVPEQP